MKSQKIQELDQWREVYFNKPLIDLSKYFTANDKQVIEKLKIMLEDKIYTEYEFECLEMDIIAFYRKKKLIEKLGLTYEKVERLWNICDKIREEYKI